MKNYYVEIRNCELIRFNSKRDRYLHILKSVDSLSISSAEARAKYPEQFKIWADEKKEAISIVYRELQDRKIHPVGTFDKAKRFWASNSDLISCRTPSRSWPYSQMIACRTKKYVSRVWGKLNCSTVEELRANV